MIKSITAFLLFIIFVSCNNNNVEKTDIKVTVAELGSPASDSCAEPYLATDGAGKVFLSWIEKNGKQSMLRFAFFNDGKWSEPGTISTGSNWFLNWADYPVIASDGKENLIAHFLEKSAAGTYAYDVKTILSNDGGKTWSNPKLLHDDGKQAEHGFVSIVSFNGKFFATWLDGRNSPAENGHDHGGHHGQMTIRGAVIDKTGNKENEWELDNRVCDCCQTSAAVAANGPVVVYRDRSEEEIRDISIVRFVNGQWTSPKTIYADNWKIAGCPVNGPRIDALGNKLAIAWFSMADQQGKVNIIFSDNGGEIFGKPVRIDEGKAIGRVDVLLIDEKTAMVSWMEGPSIKAAKVYTDGTKDSSFTIASSSEARSSGFPQMARTGNKIVFAWTDNKEKTIKLATVDL